MAFFSCFSSSLVYVSLRIDPLSLPSTAISCRSCTSKIPIFAPKSKTTEPFCEQVARKGTNQCIDRDFLGGSTMLSRPNSGRNYVICRKSSGVYASWIPSCQIAGTAFTWGTAAVLPFYTFMIVAPKTEFTKKVVGSSIPYVLLATLYGYLLYLSWTPDTIRLMFASKYWLPELQGMANLFSSEMTLASAWIHLLAVDLFAARQVYNDGLQNNIETRHSVSLCLMSCPIGILAHLITKAITRSRGKSD